MRSALAHGHVPRVPSIANAPRRIRCPRMSWHEITAAISTAFKDAATGAAAIIAVWVAWKGLTTWRRQLKGQADFEVARGLVRATYILRDAFWSCRAPLLMAGEFPDGWALHGHQSNEERAQGHAFLYRNRWKDVGDALRTFDSAALEAEAMWGADARTRTDAVRLCIQDLNFSIATLVEQIASGNSDQASMRALRRDTAASRERGDDPLSVKMRNAITNLEDFARPHLKRES